MSQTRIIVFLRAPRPGFVKTRLGKVIGPEAACAAHRRMVERVLPEVRAAGLATELRFTPDDAMAEVRGWAEAGWRLAPQGQGDLGARLARAVEAAFADGMARVILIGTDCPYLTVDDLRDAESKLTSVDAVVGPAADGGYWLLGMRRFEPALFADVPWSTDGVLAATLEKAHNLGLTLEMLRILEDVDTVEGWRRFEGC